MGAGIDEVIGVGTRVGKLMVVGAVVGAVVGMSVGSVIFKTNMSGDKTLINLLVLIYVQLTF